jgi:hypothetical protein
MVCTAPRLSAFSKEAQPVWGMCNFNSVSKCEFNFKLINELPLNICPDVVKPFIQLGSTPLKF